MSVQDDERERELVRLFNLNWDPGHQRGGLDAELTLDIDHSSYILDVEVKSTTNDTVSTARDVGMSHIARWRRMMFVIGFYATAASRRPELRKCLCLTPDDMAPWIDSVEEKILTDFKLAECSSRKLELDDMFRICEERPTYTIQDAKRLQKSQWNVAQYTGALDTVDAMGNPALSQHKMLEILRLRSKYIAERGATLNNPHMPKRFLERFFATSREVEINSCAAEIRRIAMDFVRSNPSHPAITQSAS